MKHVLLGSTALVAAGLMAGTASAADPVKLGITGFYQAAMGAALGQDDATGESGDKRRSHSFETNGEVRFTGETTLDNGLTVGARVEMEAFQSADQIDQAYAYISGGFGEVRLGDTLEALSQMCYIAPQAGSLFGADSPNFNFSNAGVNGYSGTNGTCYGLAAEQSSIIYFSPSFGGFSFAASYAPDGTDTVGGGIGNAGGTKATNNYGQRSQLFSAALSFSHDFNGFSMAAGGGASFAGREIHTLAASGIDESIEDYQAYLQFGFGGWTIGGAFEMTTDYLTTAANLDRWVGSIGATYAWDAWTVGLTWSHGEYEMTSSSDNDNQDIKHKVT